ncbi:hypothetical protein BC628DRAFT_1340670 [Trametes gibbosa]|nr:hypothetical protein BC628DRAFT_1340670 [Trametes gibbosa]
MGSLQTSEMIWTSTMVVDCDDAETKTGQAAKSRRVDNPSQPFVLPTLSSPSEFFASSSIIPRSIITLSVDDSDESEIDDDLRYTSSGLNSSSGSYESDTDTEKDVNIEHDEITTLMSHKAVPQHSVSGSKKKAHLPKCATLATVQDMIKEIVTRCCKQKHTVKPTTNKDNKAPIPATLPVHLDCTPGLALLAGAKSKKDFIYEFLVKVETNKACLHAQVIIITKKANGSVNGVFKDRKPSPVPTLLEIPVARGAPQGPAQNGGRDDSTS